jgi:hypothetical protein
MYHKKIEGDGERFGFDLFMILKTLSQTKKNAIETNATLREPFYLNFVN